MTFEEWLKTRQDARQWSEDELACAEIAWNEAVKEYNRDLKKQVEKTIYKLEEIKK